MARIDKAFEGVVYTRINGLVHTLRAGDEVPAGANIGEHLLGGGTATETVEEYDDAVVIEYPGDNATREALNAYAEYIGLDPDEYSNKSDLVAAIHQN